MADLSFQNSVKVLDLRTRLIGIFGKFASSKIEEAAIDLETNGRADLAKVLREGVMHGRSTRTKQRRSKHHR